MPNTTINKHYTHVMLDVDGTLSDSFAANDRATHACRQKLFNRPATKYELIKSYIHSTDFQFLDCTQEMKLSVLDIYQAKFAKYPSLLYEGVAEGMQLLKQANLKTVVVTSRVMSELLMDVEFSKIKDYFDILLAADSVKNPKPAPDIAAKYMQLTGALPSDIIYLGDTQNDVSCAKACNIDFALASWGAQDLSLPCEYKFTSFYQFAKAVVGC